MNLFITIGLAWVGISLLGGFLWALALWAHRRPASNRVPAEALERAVTAQAQAFVPAQGHEQQQTVPTRV